MAKSNGHTVCCIVWPGRLGEIERTLHHRLDLVFVRTAVAGDGLFDFSRCVFGEGQFVLGDSQEDRTASLTYTDRRCDIAAKKEFFHGHFIGRKFFENALKIVIKF